MALQYSIKQVINPGGTGTTAVTGVGFTPKLAIVFGSVGVPSQGLACRFRIGIDDAIGHFSKSINPGLFVGVHVADGYMSNSYSFISVRTQGLNELMVLGYFQSFNSDGGTIKWDFNLAADGLIFYVVFIGGSGINAKVFGMQPTSSPFSVTTPGFQPTGLFGFNLGDIFSTVLLPDGGNIAIGCSGDIACGQLTATAGGYKSFPAGGIVNAKEYQKYGEWITVIDSSTGAIVRRNIVTSMDPTGFTITNTGGGTYAIAAINGCAVNAGVFNQPVTTGPFNVSINAASGKLAILFSYGKPTSATSVDDILISFGAGYIGNQVSIWTGALAGSTSERADYDASNSFIGIVRTPTGNYASTLNTQVSLTGFANRQMQLNFPLVDGIAREWGYMIFADDAPGQPCGGPPPITGAGIYRIVIDKTHDTIYTTFPSTVDVKIP